MTQHADRWSLIIPVKRVEIAKTRLALEVDARSTLAIAMALDTIAAAIGSELVAAVVVVTDDQRARTALRELEVTIVADVPDAGLNAALTHGAASALTSRVAAMSSDLPALRAEDLSLVLAEAQGHATAVVADVQGSGTTLLCAQSRAAFAPQFGVSSLAAHVAAGAFDLTPVAPESVRRDVDTVDDLRAAVALGVGLRTRQALESLSVELDR
ncbi:MAG TPA: 2-phospho-L-lactate guanylyltransferase [Mycobacteriales bacterium]|jgi:2-phospho-L-lactate guanylyltransferase|nr:2-phospho-L-lactate guanylyltransferase [Mycobacteriales bacterium]